MAVNAKAAAKCSVSTLSTRRISSTTSLGLLVLAELERRVHDVVHRVQRVVRARLELGLAQLVLGRLHRRPVGVDRLLPVAEPREDVRRHVLRVRRRGRDLRVATRGVEALVGDGREVVAVDQVVGHSRMLGLLGEDLLEDGRGLELVRVRLVVGIERHVQGQRVEDRRLAARERERDRRADDRGGGERPRPRRRRGGPAVRERHRRHPRLELYLLYGEIERRLRERGLRPERRLVGSYITSLEMAGASLTLLELDDELTALWDAPVHTPALRWGA